MKKKPVAEYTPEPIETTGVELPAAVEQLMEELARHNHEVWARSRMREGWTPGPRRDDVAKTHPDLVPYEHLSEGEKEYDRDSARETLRAIARVGYLIVPADPSAVLESGPEQSLNDFRSSGADLRAQGEPLRAYDTLAKGLERWPNDARLLQLFAFVLADLGCTEEARATFAQVDTTKLDGRALEETLGVIGRIYKDLALGIDGRSRTDRRRRRELIARAFEAYHTAFRRTGGEWTAINAATTAMLLSNRRTQALELARAARAQCEKRLRAASRKRRTGGAQLTDEERYWLFATLAEAALIEGSPSRAVRWYERAVATTPNAWRAIVSSRRNAHVLLEHFGLDRAPFDEALAVPKVVVFAGHMIDTPTRRRPRFPATLEAAVTKAIRRQLARIGPAICYASAACGSDILFLEAASKRRQCRTFVVLPYTADGFRRDSVDIVPGGDWGKRFDAQLARASVFPPVSNQRLTQGSRYYDFANQVLLGLAMSRAKELDTEVVGLAVWDGREGDGPGGTASTIRLWREHGIKYEWIDLEALRREVPPRAAAEPPAVDRRRGRAPDTGAVRALLFADVKGFSKMPEEMASPFVKHVLGLAGRLASRTDMKPIGREGRGDGFYLTFACARAAGRFALELSRQIASRQWERCGLPPTIVMRISVHAGVVHHVFDPVTRRFVFIGTHINRAARIEPITPPGQVYASQEFAALAALERVKDFTCKYVGRVSLAKDYGVFPMYRLAVPEDPA
jgi:class 3 adenylate cyclase